MTEVGNARPLLLFGLVGGLLLMIVAVVIAVIGGGDRTTAPARTPTSFQRVDLSQVPLGSDPQVGRPTPTPGPSASPEPMAMEPPRPLLMPEVVAERAPLPFCGHETVRRTANGDTYDADAWKCLLDAVASGGAAELVTDSPTVEGAPFRQIIRVLADGWIEAWFDGTQDPLGAPQWTRMVCRRLESHQPDPDDSAMHIPGGCDEPVVVLDGTDPEAPSGAEMAMLESLVLFAREPSEPGLQTVPLDPDGVWLGLADQLIRRVPPDALLDPTAWILDAEAFRGRVGPFSALELLRDWDLAANGVPVREASVTVGEHPHCDASAVPAPPAVDRLRRLSIQPVGADSCLSWWTVDAFVNGGVITAITLDLYEP